MQEGSCQDNGSHTRDHAAPEGGAGSSVPDAPMSAELAPAARAPLYAARDLNRCSGLLALSVLLDSSVEHYRGNFHNKAMYTPLSVSTLSLAASVHGVTGRRPLGHKTRLAVFALAIVTGVAGTLFHVYDIIRKPGGFSWQNLFYSAPLGAPSALTVAGLTGFFAERVRRGQTQVFGQDAARLAAITSAVAMVGTTAEAGLLHFRGAFHNPFMFLPVAMPPIAAGFLAYAGITTPRTAYPFTRRLLTATSLMGLAGTAFHVYGVSRAMGGWRNWQQNMVDGPPIPAPPSFSALAFAGIAALRLLGAKAPNGPERLGATKTGATGAVPRA